MRGDVPDSDPSETTVDQAGTWTTIAAELAPEGISPSYSTWTGEELVVGFSPDVAAYRPGADPERSWRTLPPHPGGAVQVRGVVQRPGASIFVYGVRSCEACDWEPSLYSLNAASGTWRRHADAPGPVGEGQVAVTIVGTQPVLVRDRQPAGLQVLMYDPAADRWLDLDVPAIGFRRWQAIGAGRQMLIVGVTSGPEGGEVPTAVAYSRNTEEWRDVSDGLSLRAPDRITAVWTGSAVVLFGAAGRDGSPEGAVMRIDGDSWQSLPPLPVFHSLLPPFDGRALVGLTGVWDGARAGFLGGLSQPLFVAWSPFSHEWQVRRPPQPPEGGQASWTGQQILLWGGAANGPQPDLQAWGRPSTLTSASD